MIWPWGLPRNRASAPAALSAPGREVSFPVPGLFERLAASARVTVVSAPPGSGKTILLRSWIGETGLGESAA
jgi:ATP/maltotriose-dependent transcriptional regulator MalT